MAIIFGPGSERRGLRMMKGKLKIYIQKERAGLDENFLKI